MKPDAPLPDAAPPPAKDRLDRPANEDGSEAAGTPQVMRPPDDPGVGESDEDDRRFAV